MQLDGAGPRGGGGNAERAHRHCLQFDSHFEHLTGEFCATVQLFLGQDSKLETIRPKPQTVNLTPHSSFQNQVSRRVPTPNPGPTNGFLLRQRYLCLKQILNFGSWTGPDWEAAVDTRNALIAKRYKSDVCINRARKLMADKVSLSSQFGPQTLNPKPQTRNPKPETPKSKPQTPNPEPQTPNSRP